MSLEDVFRASRLAWGGNGPGSSWDKTERIRSELPALLRELGVKSLLDYGCGEPAWIGQTMLEVEVEYVGVDVVPELIGRCEACYGASGAARFLLLEDFDQPLPRADLILARDCLAHLSLDDVFVALAQMRASDAEWLLVTSCRSQTSNPTGKTGGFRPLSFRAPPFSFGEPELWIDELEDDKSLGLWRMSDAVPRGWAV